MKFGSLFSGIGGLDLGLERAGMECAWQVETDEWCSRVLARHWPDVPRWKDVRDFPGGDATGSLAVDLICGGFPCQPVSLAGKRKAQEDARWLWPEFVRVVGLFRPRYVLVENVPGLLTRGGVDVIADLTALGYDCEWSVVSAADVGAPHLRKRVFIVAHAKELFVNGSDDYTRIFMGRETVSEPRNDSGTADVANALGAELRNKSGFLSRGVGSGPSTGGDWWAIEPDVGRVANGISRRVDRLRGLGNAVVPQVAEYVGRLIMEAERHSNVVEST